MRTKLVIFTGCLLAIISSISYAACGCVQQRVVTSCQNSFCVQRDNPCDCTDPGWRWNTCMSKAKYCDAFGDIGGLDE